MTDEEVAFTNNQGENDIRWPVASKISVLHLWKGENLLPVRSYLSTCRKNDVSATDALTMLFEPTFRTR